MSDLEMEDAGGTQPLDQVAVGGADSGSEGGEEEATATPAPSAQPTMGAPLNTPFAAAAAYAAALAHQQAQLSGPHQPTMLMRVPSLQSMQASPSPSASVLTGTAPAGGAFFSATGAHVPPPPAARKRSSAKPRVSRSKKTKLEDGSTGSPLDRPPMQRSTSSRRAGGGRDGGGPPDSPAFSRASSTPQGGYGYTPPELQASTLFSSTAAMPYVPTRRERVVCIVPGSDTIKIGFAEANRPFFVRQLLAFKVAPPAPQPTPVATGGDEEMKDAAPAADAQPAPKRRSRSPASSARPAASSSTQLSDLDAATAENEYDEAHLSSSDRTLLARWRRRRDADLASAEKSLNKKRTAAEKARAARLVQPLGSIHDADQILQILPTDDAQAAPANGSANPAASAPRVLHASALLGPVPPVASDGSRYLPRRPFARGGFNLSRSTPLARVADWSEEVLRQACGQHLGLDHLSHFAAHSVSLVAPDSWHAQELREYVELLLVRLGFREVFVVREAVASCFGAGLASACVVDLGAHTTTVACVEDGLLLPHTRVELNYGSRDLENVLRDAVVDKTFWTSRQNALNKAEKLGPSEESVAAARLDEQVRQWKEKYCYCLKQEEEEEATEADEADATAQAVAAAVAAQAVIFTPHPPAALPPSVPTELHVAAALAPLAMFHPSLFLTHLHSTSRQHRLDVLDAARAREDPHLAAFFASSYSASSIAATVHAEDPTFDPACLDEEFVMWTPGADSTNSKTTSAATPASSPTKATSSKADRVRVKEEKDAAAEETSSNGGGGAEVDGPSPVSSFLARRQGLHLAVGRSLQAAGPGGLEAQNRLATSILLTGGGCNLPHFLEAFEERLVDVIPYMVTGVNTIACLIHPKGVDSAHLSWRGAAILARAETTRDMWISADEWRRYGAKLFREKVPFAC